MRSILAVFFVVIVSASRTYANPESKYLNVRKEMATGLKIDVTRHKHFRYLPSLDECGISNAEGKEEKHNRRHKRVVGGKPLINGRAPWMIQLYLHNSTSGKSEFHCGASLITRNVILTAAHCVSRIPSGSSLSAVMYGEVDRRNVKICETEIERNCTRKNQREIEETVIHEHYSEGNLQNDIALIKLTGDLEFNSTARPICLPFTEDILDLWTDTELQATGWGTQNKFDDPSPKKLSNVLEEVRIPLRKRKYCDRFHTRLYGTLSGSRFCAGGGEAGKDTCAGDSGSSIVHPQFMDGGEEKFFQYGIVSSGHVSTCGWQGRPSIYTNVMYFMPWILDHLGRKHAGEIPLNPIYTHKHNYNNVLSTGCHIDERKNPSRSLLPNSNECGSWLNARRKDDNPPLGSDKLGFRTRRVIGGRSSGGIQTFPWMAQIFVRDTMTNAISLRCSGSVINSRTILTSATCVTEIGAQYTLDSVVVGSYNRKETKECIETDKPDEPKCFSHYSPQILEVIIHHKYTKFTHQNDIALITVADDIPYNDFIQPICLPVYEKMTEDWPNYRFTSAGWGRVTTDLVENYTSSNVLQSIQVDLLDRKECDLIFTRLWGNLERSRLCGGGRPGIGECKGDIGSPLMKSFGSRRNVYQFGILSITECAQQGVPSVYTNVLSHIPWILRHIA